MALIINEKRMKKILIQMGKEIELFSNDINNLVFIGIKRKGDVIADRIRKYMNRDIPLGSININLYRDDLESNNEDAVVSDVDIQFSLDGRDVIIFDDVLYTGRTIRAAFNAIFDHHGRPKSIKLAILVDRGGREIPVYADYIGHKVNLDETTNYVMVKVLEYDGVNSIHILNGSKHE